MMSPAFESVANQTHQVKPSKGPETCAFALDYWPTQAPWSSQWQ